MTITQYQEETKRTMPNLSDKMPDDIKRADEIHMILGMTTEVGEIVDPFKKCYAYNKPIDYINIKEEIGDLMWYISNLCNLNDWNLEDILETNINKLRARYPDKFDADLAINRNLDKEKETLI